VNAPEDRKYTRSHEWALPEGELVRAGVTEYARDQLGDLVFLELPQPGRPVEQGEGFGVIESVKAVSDLLAPVGGEIVEANHALEDDLEAISEDPYGRGWLVVIRPSKPEELTTLLDAAAYQQHCAEEEAK